MMIFKQYKYFLKIRHFVKFRCDEICSSHGVQMAETGAIVCNKPSLETAKVIKKKVTKQISEKGEETAEDTNPSSASSKGVHMEQEDSVIQAETTDVKEDFNKKDQRISKKEEDITVNDFLIRNIMTFPLHVTFDETETIPEEVKVKRFPSVTSILQETMPFDARKRLDIWKQKMIDTMGPEKFVAYQNDPVKKVKQKRLKYNKRSKKIVVATLNRGTRFHTALKSYLLGEGMAKISVTKEVEGCWNSVKPVLADISEVKVVESDVFHPHLQYKGIIDCVASYKNIPYVIEWKQSEKVKKDLSDTFDAPIQLTAYMGALPWCKKALLSAPVTRGLVVVAYFNGAPAEVFQMDLNFCQSYWEQWLRRLQRYWAARSHNLRRPGC